MKKTKSKVLSLTLATTFFVATTANSYAMSAARKNKEVGAPKYNDEVVYMYLSHFVDFEGDNYEEGLCTYITKYDREAYDRYLSRGSAFRNANSMRSVITNLIALKGDLPSF